MNMSLTPSELSDIRRPIADAAHAHLKRWYNAKPNFGLMGEYSAGKSTMLNFLLGETVLPTRVTATNLPPIWLSYGLESICTGLKHTGETETFDVSELPIRGDRGYFVIRLTAPIAALTHTDIIDTPGISDPRLDESSLAFLQSYLDFVIWCTGATQAWRQSEKAAWSAFPEALQQRSILTITRIDKLRRSADLAKVLNRVKGAASQSFAQILPLATLQAIEASADPELRSDNALWETSGGQAFMEAVEQAVFTSSTLQAERAQQAEAEIAAAAAEEEAARKTAAFTAALSEGVALAVEQTGEERVNSHKLDTIQHLLTTIEGQSVLDDDHKATLEDIFLPDDFEEVSSRKLAQRIAQFIGGSSKEEEHDQPIDNDSSEDHQDPQHDAAVDESQHHQKEDTKETFMSNTDISGLTNIGGFIGACLVDSETGLMMASEGGAGFDLEAAGAANTEVVKAKLSAIDMLGLNDKIDDILITLGKQFHLIRPLEQSPTVFIYVALDKKSANLGMARVQVKKVEQTLSI